MEKKCNAPIGFTIYEIHKLFIDNIRKECQSLNINPTYRFIFYILKQNPEGLSQNDICNQIHYKKSSISVLLQQMEEEGLIIREKSKTDSRQSIVKITNKGQEFDDKITTIFLNQDKKLESCLNEDELISLKNSLIKIVNELKGE